MKKIASIANELIAKAEAHAISADLKAVKSGKGKAKKASGKAKAKEALSSDPEKGISKLVKKATKKAAKKVYPKFLT